MSSIFSKNNSGDKQKKSKSETTNDELIISKNFNENNKSKRKTDIDSLTDDDDEFYGANTTSSVINQVLQMSLALEDIMKAIPTNATKLPDSKLQSTHTEWRWRFFDLKGRKLIEISQKKPNEERLYMDNKGKWTKFNLKGDWDKFLTDIRYSYGK
jgi:hypothetical protein